MPAKKQILIRLDPELYEYARFKCQNEWGIGLSPLIKVFLKAFVTQDGVGFWIGDQNLRRKFNDWLLKKALEKNRKGRHAPLPGPRLKDLYEL
ncbi:hypothetical protein IPG41_04185 [Candidatus Peregrinibacteria bacterium]|nr:MAG: hypothetical protein IPG41_04185 [Candidatus Peregrinibacteria bacterium]